MSSSNISSIIYSSSSKCSIINHRATIEQQHHQLLKSAIEVPIAAAITASISSSIAVVTTTAISSVIAQLQ